MRRRARALTLLFVAAAQATLAGSGCGKPGPAEPPPPGYEGTFHFARYRTTFPGTATEVFLYADVRFTTTAGFLDAGPSLTLAGPTGEVELERIDVLGKIFYQKDPQGPDIDPAFFVADAGYAVRVRGSGADQGVRPFELDTALETPEILEMLTPDFSAGEVVVDGTTDLPLSWTPGNGDYLDVILAVSSSGTGVTDSFRVADDGAFDLPASRLAALPVGSGSLTVVRTINLPHSLPHEGVGRGIGGDAVSCKFTRQ